MIGMAVVGAAIVLVSAVLVGTPPAQAVAADPVDVTMQLEGSAGASGSVQVTVAPARAGSNVLQLYLYDDEGRATQPEQIRVAITEEQQEIGPLDVEIAAAGGHSVLMAGPPGSGKSMLALRFAGLLPAMTVQEALESVRRVVDLGAPFNPETLQATVVIAASDYVQYALLARYSVVLRTEAPMIRTVRGAGYALDPPRG